MLSFGQIRDRVAYNVQVLATDQYALQTIPRFIQERYRKIWDADNWNDLVGNTYLATIAANGNSFVLPKQYAAVLKAYNAATGGPISIRDFVTFGDDAFTIVTNLNPTNDFTTMARMASQGVFVQLTSTQSVNIVSSSNNDVAQIFIRGLDANGERITEGLTLDGVRGVASVNSYSAIEAWSKTQIPTQGTITLTDSLSNTLSTLGQWETSPEYRVYRLNGNTTAQSTVQCIVKKSFVPMLHTYDVPFMEMDDALIFGATADAWREHRQLDLAAKADADFDEAMAGLRDKEFEEEGSMYCLPLLRA